jgi:hypothetical protein
LYVVKGDLGFFFRPKRRFPLSHQIAPRLDPHIGRGLLSPEIEQKHPPPLIDADHHMHGVVAAV